MKLRLLVLTLVLVVPLVGPALVAPRSVAAAPRMPVSSPLTSLTLPDMASRLALNPFANIPVAGQATSPSHPNALGGAFSGRLTVRDFGVQNGTLVAHLALKGTLTNAVGTRQVVNVLTTATASVTGTCQVLTLTLGPLHLDLLGLVVDLNRVTLTITGEQGPGELLGNLVCALANLLNQTPPAPLSQQAAALNELHTLLQQQLDNLTSTFAAGPHNTLVQQVLLYGTVVTTTTATITATCQVLTLDLGPLRLDLLGLVIHLSPVHLTITAQPGNGHLLGNLICDIANLLNGGAPPSAVVNPLNQLLALLPTKLLPIPIPLL